MASVGVDCDVAFNHPSVNGGEDYGFLLQPAGDGSPAVMAQRQSYGNGQASVHLFFNLLFSDRSINPNGGRRTTTRTQDYVKFREYIEYAEDVTVISFGGVFPYAGQDGYDVTETHYPDYSVVQCNFNNGRLDDSTAVIPASGLQDYINSLWDGGLLWGEAFWR